jgi:hypothetical protein
MSISITARFGGVPLLTAAFFGAGVALFGTAANASNVHLKPPNSSPSFIDNGITLTASGALAGLGNEDVIVNLSATGSITQEFCMISGGQPQRQEILWGERRGNGTIVAAIEPMRVPHATGQ